MTLNGWIQIALFGAIVVALTKPLGGYMTRVFAGERTWLTPVLRPVERGFYRLAGVDDQADQHWTAYAVSMLLFNLAGFLFLYLVQRLQGVLPLNPQGPQGVPPDLAFNTGTFPTHSPLFVGLLVGVILIVGGLTYFPALSLGPIVEHLAMQAGTLF